MVPTNPKPIVYCFDLDGTLCTNTEGDYTQAKPYPDRIERLNRLFDQGHTIVIYTARGTKTGIDWKDLTNQQLSEWHVKYHTLQMGKPYADIYIDDKCLHVSEWLSGKHAP